MSKLSIKPAWLGILALLIALGVAIRIAMALASFSPADQPVGYVAQDEVTNFDLRSDNETLYRGNYDRERWSGGLFAYPVSKTGFVDVAGRRWDAGDQIDLQNFSSGRYIATMQDNGTAVPFRLGNLSAAQQLALNNSAALVNYLRGERTAEGSTYRLRTHVLGDIVHSRPLYVVDVANPTVFAGSNDGMLHAINASPAGGGDERWAYIPSMLLPKLKNLASTATPFVHDYYVDGQINVATINSGATRALVGGLGAGGKGLFALNITGSAGLAAASEAAVASKVMWEISPTGINYASPMVANAYINLGYTYGTVTMAKVGGVDAVIVGNGYNDGLVSDYSACTPVAPAVTASYTNCGGNYAAYLYVINAMTGQLIRAIKVGADGTSTSPNGLSTPAAVDTAGVGSVDRVYAGDLNGSMWKIDLSTGVATQLIATSPSQSITSTPGVAVHPNGGYMVTFGTGRMLSNADASDTAAHYVYGIWDGAPAANAVMLTQTLTERSYTVGGVTTRVRNVTSNQPVWTSGALNHKGWQVALPAGERVVGEGSFIQNQRFYFTSTDPTKTAPVITGTTTTIKGENWLMELDYLTGGSKNQPFLDLSGDVILNDVDRIKYTATDTLPLTVPATVVGDPILTTYGIAVGKFISTGVLSQPILVQNITLNDTLFNQNPDVTIPPVVLGQGVDGGHFDQDIYYRSGAAAGGAQATATITVSTTGQTNPFPATLGAITLNGVQVVPPLTVTDIPNGTLNNANASKIASLVGNGFSATVSGNVVTVKAPVGVDYNGLTLAIADGTSQSPLTPAVVGTAVAAAAAVAPTNGSFLVSDVSDGATVSFKCGSSFIGTAAAFTVGTGNRNSKLTDIFNAINSKTVNGYTTTCSLSGSGNSTTVACSVQAPPGVSACSSTSNPANFAIAASSGGTITVGSNTGPQGGSNAAAAVPGTSSFPQSGFTNFKPALVATAFTGGADGTVAADNCTTSFGFFTVNFCAAKNHIHQYDKIYDVTGVNMLNASSAAQNLSNAIPSTSTKFKVLLHNQYLSPAVKIHIGNPGYLFNVDAGYVRVKDFMTTATLDMTTLPTYSRSTVATGTSIPIGSLAFNMPTDALTARDWWGVGDVRAGLHPTVYSCAYSSSGISGTDGNMYQPVIPPANGVDGPGTTGWNAGSMPGAWPASTATGARHNGALTMQIVAANTPNSAIEQNLAGRPEYGWRVRSADFGTYVLAEFTIYWHHPNGKCYSTAGWTKAPGPDPGLSTPVPKAAGSTDPKIGVLGVGAGTIVSTVTTTSANVTTTTITYSSGLTASIVRTANTSDGTVSIVTTDTTGSVTTQVVANTAGTVKSGGDERGLQAKTGRISWRELVAP